MFFLTLVFANIRTFDIEYEHKCAYDYLTVNSEKWCGAKKEGIVQISLDSVQILVMQNSESENFTFGNDIEMIFHSDSRNGKKYDGFEFLLTCKGLYLINTAYQRW